MSAQILSGAAVAADIKASVGEKAATLAKRLGRPVALALVCSNSDAATQSYLKARVKACQSVGIEPRELLIAPGWNTQRLRQELEDVAKNGSLDALIVDFPLPKEIDAQKIREAIAPQKDAEGLCSERFGRLFLAKTYDEASSLIAPPTAKACAELVRRTKIPLEGLNAVVIGRSPVVGRPAAQLLNLLGLTVTVAHSHTRDLEGEIRRADVVVAAVGKARLVRGEWIKPGAIVIDAGVNQDGASLCGDVEFEAASKLASYITPVPGGVGPVTTACLLANAVLLAETAVSPKT